MDKCLISVVTVCLNAEKDIGYTVNSILEQDHTDFEYLIKDGGSSDSTLSVAEGYAERFREKGISFRIISERDEGVYDAMNRAAELASGEWIMYMNAGDALFDSGVLSRFASEFSDDTDVIYGDAVYLEKGRYKLLKAGGFQEFKLRNPICHQASIVRTDVLRKYRFDTGYKVSADFDMFLRMYLSGEKRFKRLDDTFGIFLLGGISNELIAEREKEFDRSRVRSGLERVRFPRIQMMKICALYKIRALAVRILGDSFYSEGRGWYAEKEDAVRAKARKADASKPDAVKAGEYDE